MELVHKLLSKQHHHHLHYHGGLGRASLLVIQSSQLFMHVESSAVVVAPVFTLRVSMKVVADLPGTLPAMGWLPQDKMASLELFVAVTVASDPKTPPGDLVRSSL